MKIKAILRAFFTTLLPLVVGVAALVIVIAWMSGMFDEKIAPGYRPVGLEKLKPEQRELLYEVKPITQAVYEEAVGTLRASQRTEISSRVLVPINKITVRAGQPVIEGELLIELDGRALETQLSQVRASLVAAEAARRQTESDYRRDIQLIQKNTISRAQYDQSKAAYEVARAKWDVAQQAVKEAEVNLSYTKITAPRPGIIVDRHAEVGDMARPGVPLLTLYDPTTLRLEVPVTEKLAMTLKIGQPLTVHIDSLDRDVEATVDERVPQAEAASRSFLVKVALPKADDLYEGLLGRLRIPAGQRVFLCLDRQAIERIGQLQYVTVVLPDDRLERRLITTGRGRIDRVEVLSGLKAGDQVLLKEKQNPKSPAKNLKE